MADFLASFNFGSDTPQPSNAQLASVDELTQQLAAALGAKVQETRTEHVAMTIELRAAVQLRLQLSAQENNALAGGAGVEQPGSGFLRVVKINDALMNQPQDTPVLQEAVAKHIVAAVGATDQSTWVVREISRATQGWTFRYICKDSLQMWTRRTSKAHNIPVIGEYSYKDPDPVLTSMCPASYDISLLHANDNHRPTSFRLSRLHYDMFLPNQSLPGLHLRPYTDSQDCGGSQPALQADPEGAGTRHAEFRGAKQDSRLVEKEGGEKGKGAGRA
jgi:hypothetical protein